MHTASIEEKSESIPARLYRELKARMGMWVGADELNWKREGVWSTCLSTHLSAIRHRLPADQALEHKQETTAEGKRLQKYRLVGGQLGKAAPLGRENMTMQENETTTVVRYRDSGFEIAEVRDGRGRLVAVAGRSAHMSSPLKAGGDLSDSPVRQEEPPPPAFP